MLIPLGVLALGAVFSGMVWYKVFFGEETAVRDWFGMEAAAHDEGHGDTAAATHTTEAPAEGGPAPAEAHGDTAATEAAPTDAHSPAGVVPKGALVMLPFTAEEQAIVDGRLDPAKVEKAEHAPTTMINAAHLVPAWVKVSPFVAMLIGLGLAWLFYIKNPSLPGRLAAQQRPLYLFLLNKWYFDELYDWLFVRPAKWLGNFLWKKGDGAVIDGSLNGVAMGIIPFFTRLAGRAQSGYLFHYAFAMVLGIVILVTWMTLFGGAK
jgi:NADH-quinone oxidoreductase subunit L